MGLRIDVPDITGVSDLTDLQGPQARREACCGSPGATA